MTKATAKPEPEAEAPEAEAPVPAPVDFDPRDVRIATLENQVESLEDFLNVVIAQRNDAQNQSAQYHSQLLKCQKQGA